MADLAERLNNIYNGVQTPGPLTAPPPVAAAPPAGASWSERFKNYLGDTNVGAVMEAFGRLNPLTMPGYWARDIAQGKFVENNRLMAGQVSRFPTDVVSGLVNMYPAVSAVNAAATGGQMSETAQSWASAADAIDEFGRKNWAEPIAGRELGTDAAGNPQAGTLLRGTGPEMAAQWARTMSQAIAPVPTKVAAPIIAGANAIKSGLGVLGPAAQVAAKTVEALTPLAISSAPSTKTAVVNLVAQGTLGVVGEAAIEAVTAPAREAKRVQDEANKIAQAGTATATEGQAAAVGEKPVVPATPQMAGIITGNNTVDALLTAGIVGAGLFAARKTEAMRRVTEGLTRAIDRPSITGYNPKNVDDASIQSVTTKIKQQYSDRSASLGDTLENTLRAQGGYTERQIQDMVGRYREEGASRQGAALSTRERQFYDTGQFMDTSIRSVSPNDLFVKYGSATPQQQRMVTEVLWDMQENDLRQRMMQKAYSTGTSPLGNAPIGSWLANTRMLNAPAIPGPWGARSMTNRYSYNLFNKSNHQLNTNIRNNMSDPVVADIVHGYRDIIRKASDYMVSQKRMTAAQAKKFMAENPNFVPPRLEKGEHFLDARDPVANLNRRTGVDIPRGAETYEKLGNPMENLPKYMDEVFRSTEGTKTKRDFMLEMMNAARNGNPYARQIIGRDLSGKPATDSAHEFVSWRDLDGNKRYTEIKDAVVRDALRGVTSPTALQLQNGFLSGMARWYESGAVGSLSTLGGTVFAPKSALYAATIGTALPRPKGVAIGWIDRLAQSTTGVSIPGVDGLTTMPIDMAVRAAGNIGTVIVERVARVMHNSVLDDKGILSLIDPKTRQAAADAMYDWYRKTAMYDMQTQGLMSPGSFMAADPAKSYSDPAAALKRWEGIKGIPGSKLIGESGSFINDILHAISAAPNMSIRAMNKPFGVPDWKTASAIRNLAGDPGAAGAFRNAEGVAGAVNATPWGNIYVQSMARLAGAFRKNPGYTMAGIFNGVAMPAAMATMWNNNQGVEYAKYQFFERTPDAQASKIYIAIPGLPPSEGLEVDIDPLMRPFKYMSEGIAALATGAFTGEMWKPGNEEERAQFNEMFKHRMGTAGEGSVFNSLVEQSLIPPVPGALQAAGAAAGVKVRSYVDARPYVERKGAGFAAGTEPGNSVLSEVMPAHAEDILRGVGASAGGAIFNFINGMGRDLNPNAAASGNVTKTTGEALHTQWKEYKQRVSDSTAELGSGPLFNTFRAIVPTQEASSQAVKAKLDNIKAINDQYQQTTVGGAPRDMLGNAKIGREERIGAHPVQPNSQQGALASDVHRLYQQITPTLSQIKVHHEQRNSIRNSNLFTPNMKRALSEEESYKIIELNRRLLQDLQRAERVLTQQYKIKVDFSNLKLQ